MTARFTYDSRRDPPVPIVPIRLGKPGTDPALSLIALVDTGADATVVPQTLARRLDLPPLGEIVVAVAGGFRQRAKIYSAVLEVAGLRWPAEVIAFGDEPLIGRDLLNQWIVTLRGPERVMEIATRGPERGARS